MSTSAAGTTFTLRTPAHIKSCHVTGSWDNYGKRYQMTADPAHPGWWSLTVKFNMAPSRYWYYVSVAVLDILASTYKNYSTSSMATLSLTTQTAPTATSLPVN
jgi:hypothetical protein